MQALELVLGLLVAVIALSLLAPTLRVPSPVLLVLGGVLLALLPQVPDIVLAPDLAFLLFLPPLLYSAAFDTSVRDLRAHLPPILSLAIGLVLATTVAVAILLRSVLPEVPWALAFAFGAIISPPDAVAAVAVVRNLGVPRRLVTVLEGESLFNDATAIILYQAALVAAATATFDARDATVRFVFVGIGGLALGLAIGWVVAFVTRRIFDTVIEIAISLLTPFGAYIAAEHLGVSGVLATVAAGLCAGWWAPTLSRPETRLRSRAIWDLATFLLNGLVFILIGLQELRVLPALSIRPLGVLVGVGLLASLTVILIRFAWVLGVEYLRRLITGHASDTSIRDRVVISWAGMRGVVSLATALALPLDLPDRDLLIFLTFCVILVTLVGQGLTLPLLVRLLHVTDDGDGDNQERRARRVATEAGLSRLDELADQWPGHLPLIDSLRAQYTHRASHFEEPRAENSMDAEAAQEVLEHRQIRAAVLDAERDAVLRLRSGGSLDEETWLKIQRDLDLEAVRQDA